MSKTAIHLPIADWTDGATVRIKSKGPGRLPMRKVETTGSTRVKLNRTQLTRLVGATHRGEETYIAYEGEDIIRIFPYLDADTGRMFLLAKTLGNFRSKMFTGQKLRLTSPNGRKELSRDEFNEMVESARNEKREHVTPETLVRCPRFGKEFKVGKSLA